MAIRAAVMSGDPPRRTRLALAHAGEVLGRARRMRQPRESTGCPATTVQVDAEQPPPISAEDASESCVICMSRPRAVRFLPCQHAVMCELCTIETMQRSGQCPNCRAAVARLVVVPVNVTLHQPTRPEEVDVSGELASDATTSPLATATITLQLMRKNGQFGLGVRPDNYVMEVDEGSGAHEAGMRPGDWIVSVSNVAVATYAETLPLLTAVWECIPTPVVVRYVVADHPDRRAPYHPDHPDRRAPPVVVVRRAPPVVVVQGTPTGPLAVPLDQPLQPRRLQTHVDEPEPDGSTFESVQTFLQAMLQNADEDVAEAARNALRAHRSEAPAAARPPPEGAFQPDPTGARRLAQAQRRAAYWRERQQRRGAGERRRRQPMSRPAGACYCSPRCRAALTCILVGIAMIGMSVGVAEAGWFVPIGSEESEALVSVLLVLGILLMVACPLLMAMFFVEPVVINS
jgi:hypothetical protein